MSASVIVVTDDEPEVLAFISVVLRRYSLKTFSSPLEAHLYLNTIKKPPRLLITDIMMPGMDGTELASAFCMRFPKVPILFISGYTPDPARMAHVSNRWEFLPKPLTPQKLREAVTGLLIAG